MSTKIWLSKPHLSKFELDYVNEAFLTNWVSTLGENIDDFERDVEFFLGSNKFVAALNSGTSSIHLALRLLDVGFGDEVICQSFTFCATANPILYQGASPVFVDSEIDTWNMSPYYLEAAIKDRLKFGKKPKAIIAVNSYGMPAKWDEILKISNNYSIPIIEDSAASFGSVYKGRMCGTIGDFGVLSFNGNKIITTSTGGALICDTKQLKKKAIFLSLQSKEKLADYIYSDLGYNYRMSNVLAGIGRGQMKVMSLRVEQRRKNNAIYSEMIKTVEGVSLQKEASKDFISNFWLNCITIDTKKSPFSKEKLIIEFLKNNIEVRGLWAPLHLQKIYVDAPFYGGGVCEQLFNNGLCLPSGSNLSEKDFFRIKNVISGT
jgi:dTDP-4-amino-4,6-dideoxygalactose transaminase